MTQNNYFVLGANALPENSITTFKLQCQKASASIVVVMNGPPVPGLYVIDPLIGDELITYFLFSASLWLDDDLPITYSFGFYSSNTSTTVATFQKRSESSFANYTLPSGQIDSNYTIRTIVTVYDSINAQSTLINIVQVYPFKASDSNALVNAIGSQLAAAMNSSNPEDALNFLAVASAVMNSVNCSSASPSYCNQLNR